MKNNDNLNLEQVYESINNKQKNLISEDANETLGAGVMWIIIAGLPFIFDYFSRKYPELKNAFNNIKNDLKNNQETKEEVKNILNNSKQKQPQRDEIAGINRKGTPKGL